LTQVILANLLWKQLCCVDSYRISEAEERRKEKKDKTLNTKPVDG
jgi:hypothetical protein